MYKRDLKKLFQKIIFSQFRFCLKTAVGVRALWVSEHPLWRTPYTDINKQAECQGYSDCNTQAECQGNYYCNTKR